MSVELLLAGAAILLLAIAVAYFVLGGPRRLTGTDWYRVPGDTFAAQEALRRERYAFARNDAARLASAVDAVRAPLGREWQQAGREIALRLVDDLGTAVASMERCLNGRDRGAGSLTVVLYGRTKAGKSSLYSALSGGGFDGIGDGNGNYTREKRTARLGSVDLVDTPGIHGVGSESLEAVTVDAVHEADVLVVEVADGAVLAEDFDRLRELGLSARPIFLALNVKDPDLTTLRCRPDRVFRQQDVEDHIARHRGALPERLRDSTPIIAYNAFAAERARRRWCRHRGAAWTNSRIQEVIQALCAAATDAPSFALTSADEAVTVACDQALIASADALAQLDVLVSAGEMLIAQVEGILREVDSRKRDGGELASTHFADAESELFEALDLSEPTEFEVIADRTLNTSALDERLNAALEEIADSLKDKYEDFRADLRLAGRASAERYGLDNLYHDARRERKRHADLKQKANRRKWSRRGARVAVAAAAIAAAAAAAETGPGGFAVGTAVNILGGDAVDLFLPEIDVPPGDPAKRLAGVSEAIKNMVEETAQRFADCVETQVTAPARAQLIDPLRRRNGELLGLRQVVDGLASSVSGVRADVAHRGISTSEEEAAIA